MSSHHSTSLFVLLFAMVLAVGCSDDTSKKEDAVEVDTAADVDGTTDADTTDAPDTDVTPDAVDVPDVEPDVEPDIAPDMPPFSLGEHCSNGIDDDNDAGLDCADTECMGTPPCTPEDCGNMVDDDGDGATDCEDLECALVASCLTEICNNGKDDDGDMDADCADMDCASLPLCGMTPEDCGNGIDDDGNLRVDCRDRSCWGDAACMGPTTSCTTEGQHCDANVPNQGDFRCLQPPGFPGSGMCFSACNPNEPEVGCPFGTACLDFNPQDNDPAGLCFIGECTEPFQQSTCGMNEECTPYVNGYMYCDPVGTAAVDEACGVQTTCGSGLLCIQGRCRQSCDLANPTCTDGACVGYFAELGYGACDTTCPEFSLDQCDMGESCVPTLMNNAWVCRPEGTREAGQPCIEAVDCQEGLGCLFGECTQVCSYYAATACEMGEVCVGFDEEMPIQAGVCGESCQDLIPDTCSSGAERCFTIREDGAGVCWEHGGGALGDPCEEFTDCGSELYCDFQDQCAQLCHPFDVGTDLCPNDQACTPFDETIGGCFPLTSTGSTVGDACAPMNATCDDGIICTSLGFGGPECVEFCRSALTAPDGSNPDCTTPFATCDDNGGDEVGICLTP